MNYNSQRGHFWEENLLVWTTTDILRPTTAAQQVMKEINSYKHIHCLMYLCIIECVWCTNTHLLKDKRLFIPHRVNGIGSGGPLGAIFLFGVTWQPNHLHLNPSFDTLVRQKLARIDLVRQVGKTWWPKLINRMDVLCGSMFRTQWIKIEHSFSLMQSLLNTRNHVSVAAGSLYYYRLCI